MKYKIVFSYDGLAFYGYAKQPNLKTIQGTLESNLSLVLNENIVLSASGRTDKGVHALNQVASFVVSREISNLDKFLYSMNKLLNEEIYIKEIKKVKDSFDARFSAKKKSYLYLINVGEFNPLKRNYELFLNNSKNDFEKFKEASKLFIGTHNFQNYCSKEEDEENFVRTIFKINIKKKKDLIEVRLIANGFMRYQVRKIVGTMIAYSLNKITYQKMEDYLNKKERDIVPFTSEPHALYLEKVYY